MAARRRRDIGSMAARLLPRDRARMALCCGMSWATATAGLQGRSGEEQLEQEYKSLAIFQMTIDCDVPPNLQLEEEVLVENLLSALISKALKDEGVQCRGVVCERLDVNPLE
jgi:hypothetical protein